VEKAGRWLATAASTGSVQAVRRLAQQYIHPTEPLQDLDVEGISFAVRQVILTLGRLM
jgi:hypothetical protein